jgi:mRNA interferase RelE/StbE
MNYKIIFTPSAIKELKKLDNFTQRIILNWFNNHKVILTAPRIIGKDLKGDLGGFWRYRVGDIRIITRIDDKSHIIYILSLGPRDQIYK